MSAGGGDCVTRSDCGQINGAQLASMNKVSVGTEEVLWIRNAADIRHWPNRGKRV